MRVLVLAPQPFYQERGTPIAMNLLLRALAERGDEVDLLTFPEGEDVEHPGLRTFRVRPIPRVRGVRPGFSAKKLVCDAAMFVETFRMLRRVRYDVVHANEEAAFMAMMATMGRGVPFVYDMDSMLSDQLVDRFRWLRGFHGLLAAMEAGPVRRAVAVVPMCDDLGVRARRMGARDVCVLKDVSLVGDAGVPARESSEEEPVESLRETFGVEGPLVLYVGNLESYQGIDLLLESFAFARERVPNAACVVIGGRDDDIATYRSRTDARGLSGRVHFAGRRPVSAIGAYMAQADLLVSPRTRGTNTPMKIYSYLDSGVTVLATDLPTHTQVMDASVAALAPAEPEAFGKEMAALLDDPVRRRALAAKARALIAREHSYEAFRRRVHELYAWLEAMHGSIQTTEPTAGRAAGG